MAREAGQYRKMLLEQRANQMHGPYGGSQWDAEFSWERFRFYVCLALFVGYVLLDYTGGSIYELDSKGILAQVQKDMTEELHLDQLLAGILDEIEITEEPVLPASTVPGEEEPGEGDTAGEPANTEEDPASDTPEEIAPAPDTPEETVSESGPEESAVEKSTELQEGEGRDKESDLTLI